MVETAARRKEFEEFVLVSDLSQLGTKAKVRASLRTGSIGRVRGGAEVRRGCAQFYGALAQFYTPVQPGEFPTSAAR